MFPDPLSDVLALLKPRSSVSTGFEAGGDWAVRFDDQQGRIKCYAVTMTPVPGKHVQAHSVRRISPP